MNGHPPASHRMGSRLLLALFIGFWGLLVMGGTALVWRYKTQPGAQGEVPSEWPETSPVRLAPGKATLVMLAHPHCPCTRASLSELAGLMSRLNGRVAARVLFLKPQRMAPGWEQSALWKAAAAIPGVEVLADDAGQMAARLGAITSGQTFLYDAQGVLRFSGGITASRGHEGDNAGTAQILEIVNHPAPGLARADVFGCSLKDPTGEKP